MMPTYRALEAAVARTTGAMTQDSSRRIRTCIWSRRTRVALVFSEARGVIGEPHQVAEVSKSVSLNWSSMTSA